VPAGDHSGVGAVREPLTDELPDGFQHPAPGPEVGVVELDQAVPRQCLGQLQCLVLVQAGHLGGGVDGPAVGEDRDDFQQGPLRVIE
jgi:hypothetical protein